MAAKVYEIAFRLAGQLSPAFTRSFWEGEKLMRSFAERTKALDEQTAALSGMSKLSEEVRNADVELRRAQATFTELSAKLQSGQASLTALEEKFQKSRSAVETSRKAVDAHNLSLQMARAEFDLSSRELQAASASTQVLASRQRQAQSAVSRFEKALKTEQDALKRARAESEAVSAQLKARGASLADTEAALTKVRAEEERARNAVLSHTQTLQRARAELSLVNGEIEAADAPTRDMIARYQQAGARVNRLEQALEAERTALKKNVAESKELGAALRAATKEEAALRRNVEASEKAVKKASTVLDRKQASLRENRLAAGMLGASLHDVARREQEVARAAEQARAAQERLAKTRKRLAAASSAQEKMSAMRSSSLGAMASTGAAAAGTMGLPVREAMKLEDSMAEVRKVVDFETPDGLINLQRQLQEMSLRIPMAADQLAMIAAAAGQSGIAEKDLATFTEQAAKMGVAFDISAEESGEMMAKWQSGMGLSLEKTYALADAVNFLSNANAAQAKQIGEVLKKYGPLGKLAGLTETHIAAFASTVIASGAEAEVAATGIKAFMRAMGKGGSMSDVQKAAFQNAGLDYRQLQKDLQKNAPETILKTLEAIQKKIPKEKWNQYLSVMFGDEAAVAIGPMMQNTEALRKNFERIADPVRYADSMLKEFEARSATTSNSLTLMGNAGKYVATVMGSPLLEPIREISLETVKAARAAGAWMEANKPLVSTAMKLGAALTTGVIAFHALRLGVLFAISPLVSVYKTWQKMKIAMTALNIAMKANPIGLLITAVGAVAAGFALAYENCEAFRNMVDAAISLAVDKISGLIEMLEKAGKFLGDILGGADDAVKAYSAMGNGNGPAWASQEQMEAIESGDLNALAVPAMASGGVVTGPTLAAIGEGTEPEAVLPLSRLSALLHQTGTGTSSYQITFSPVINISGGTDAYESVKRGMKEAQTDFRREFDRMMRDRERLSYA
ncbi:phage tail tape measure protein [uncultured Mailhella sp.]|uniref:phage tail tape measure protein n=1 Tax=uncultured Mailhella sp. TaxID=1981031 RepID=UPI0025D854E4|nr:phage tail tape measure protein [uncultured Mailhella sp.]